MHRVITSLQESRITLARLVVLGLLLPLPSIAAVPPCDSATRPGLPCACDVRFLRPLQGAVGLEEVRDKAEKIAARQDKEWKDLVADPIKVVRGPGGDLFITDHHHGADAWRVAGHPAAVCQIWARPPFGSDAEFWAGLASDRLVRLADADGKPIAASQLPGSLVTMPDDAYRSLAWRVRKDDGFCRSMMPQKAFAEFIWADWFRTQPELPADAVKASAKDMAPRALKLARSPAAKGMPGYVGSKPAGFKCPKE
jgi:hypothetical protein